MEAGRGVFQRGGSRPREKFRPGTVVVVVMVAEADVSFYLPSHA